MLEKYAESMTASGIPFERLNSSEVRARCGSEVGKGLQGDREMDN